MTSATLDEERVLGEDGEFHAKDEPVDLSGYHWEDWLTLGFFWLLAADVFYQFFTRYVLADSASWTEEIARYLLIIVTFLGASIGMRKNTHIHVEFIYKYIPAQVGRVMSTLVDAIRVLFLAYCVFLTFQLIPKMQNLKMTVIDVPMSVIYGFVAFGFIMMTWRSLRLAQQNWKQGYSVLERPETGF